MKYKLLTIPNVFTFLRLIGAISLIFIEPFTTLFFIVYSICGVSDVLDGFLARLTKSTSEFGSTLDSISDFIFYSAMLFRILPTLADVLPVWIWGIVAGIMFLRVISYSLAFFKYHRFASLHTYMNKLTSASIFVVPYFILTRWGIPVCFMGCVIGGIGTIEELLIHILMPKYSSGVHTIFKIRR